MKKKISMLILASLMLFQGTIYGSDGGEMGPYGGISEGSNLPRTIDSYVDDGIDPETTFEYMEMVFISGEPVEFVGSIEVQIDEIDIESDPTGTYEEQYTVTASSLAGDSIDREITFTTSYRVVESAFKSQIVRVSQVTNWQENLNVGGTNYTLDEERSDFSKSSIEDVTPGVSYYDTVISYNAEYDSANGGSVSVTVDGNVYGYQQPWSKVETQDLNMFIDFSTDGNDGWQMQVHLKPYMKAKKTMYYDETEPYPISFGGTYNQRLEREATLTYEILTTDRDIPEEDRSGSIYLDTNNAVEKLPIPDGLEFIEGHWAEEDIKKLYSMEIFTEVPHEGMQYEAITRGAYVKALCIAMNIDTTDYEAENLPAEPIQYYGDVTADHPYYKYIMGATDAKLVQGIGADFNVNTPITRQEAFVIYVRVIGLERLGVTENPVTPFIDDASIANWARKEIMAGYKLGIIKGTNGYVQPTRIISKSEAAAIVNRLIDYLREEISQDYQL